MPDDRAQRAYERAAVDRQRAVLVDTARTERAIVALSDDCFTAIMGDFRRGHLSPATVQNRLDAFADAVAELLDKAFSLGAHDWWGSAVALWGHAAAADPRVMAKIALEARESAGDLVKRATFALLEILDPPGLAEVLAIINAPVNGLTWRERLAGMTSKRVSQTAIAKAIAGTYAAGGNVQDVRRAIAPLVTSSAAAARRIARTESVRIANEMHERSMEEAGDIVVGFTYNAILDDVTRPEHAARHGRAFKPDQPRVSTPDGPNCRCFYSPILDADVQIFGRTVAPAAADVEVFAGWFDQQRRGRKVAIVGEAAYQRAQKRFGVQDPTWEQVTAATPTLEVDRIRGDLEARQAAALKARRASRGTEAA